MSKNPIHYEKDNLLNEMVKVAQHTRRQSDFLRVWNLLDYVFDTEILRNSNVQRFRGGILTDDDLQSEAVFVLMKCIMAWGKHKSTDPEQVSFEVYYRKALGNRFSDILKQTSGPVRLTTDAVYRKKVKTPKVSVDFIDDHYYVPPPDNVETVKDLINEIMAHLSEKERSVFTRRLKQQPYRSKAWKPVKQKIIALVEAVPRLRQLKIDTLC